MTGSGVRIPLAAPVTSSGCFGTSRCFGEAPPCEFSATRFIARLGQHARHTPVLPLCRGAKRTDGTGPLVAVAQKLVSIGPIDPTQERLLNCDLTLRSTARAVRAIAALCLRCSSSQPASSAGRSCTTAVRAPGVVMLPSLVPFMWIARPERRQRPGRNQGTATRRQGWVDNSAQLP
jgi:hypothetical protein